MKIGLTLYAAGRHWNPDFPGTKIVGMTTADLIALANEAIAAGTELVPGYAPFCKHLFVPNRSATRAGVARITADNAGLLRSGYQTRREGELPVLERWFEGVEAPVAAWLDLILYSREQLEAEAASRPADQRDVPDADWGIAAINAELHPVESPMPPITMLRNALGKEEGGSGVLLDHQTYLASVAFWQQHAVVQ